MAMTSMMFVWKMRMGMHYGFVLMEVGVLYPR